MGPLATARKHQGANWLLVSLEGSRGSIEQVNVVCEALLATEAIMGPAEI